MVSAGTLFWGPYNKDPTIQGTILGPPIFGNDRSLKRYVSWATGMVWGGPGSYTA